MAKKENTNKQLNIIIVKIEKIVFVSSSLHDLISKAIRNINNIKINLYSATVPKKSNL